MKFKAGEIAITRQAGHATKHPAGTECEIVAVGPWQAGELVMGRELVCADDYIIRYQDGSMATCEEIFLRKRPQPGIPDAILRIFKEMH